MDVLGIILSLILLMTFAYRGYSVILFAPVFALLAAVMQGMPIMPSYTELFMGKAVTYVKSFFPVFMLGAVFGKVMEDTGLAAGIAKAIIEGLGAERAILAVVLATGVLSYGGVSMFVCVFAVYPFAAAIFKRGNLPKRLIPGSIALGCLLSLWTRFQGRPKFKTLFPQNILELVYMQLRLQGSLGV